MILSAGGRFLNGPDEMSLEEEPTKRALSIMGRLGQVAGAPAIDTSNEDTARLGFEAGTANFMVNYPFVYASAKDNAPDVFKNLGAAKFPRVDEGTEARPPLGGINIGVSAFSDKQDVAWEAVQCLIKPEHQLAIAEAGGLPPVREDLYERPEMDKIYPGFADQIRDSISTAGPRPSESPAYQDLSLAIQRGLHPVTGINPEDPQEAYDNLRDLVQQAINREGLL
jgi:multiple sugar transport system substrate-binding protein